MIAKSSSIIGLVIRSTPLRNPMAQTPKPIAITANIDVSISAGEESILVNA